MEQSGTRLPDGTKARKKTTHQWYELQDACSYHETFESAKIVYSDISTSPQFHLDYEGIYFTNTAYMMTGKNLKFLLGILNSELFTYIFKLFYAGGGLGDHGYRYFKAFLENVPIPLINSQNRNIKTQIEICVDQIMKSTKNGQKFDVLDKTIDKLVYEYYSLTAGEIKLVRKNDTT